MRIIIADDDRLISSSLKTIITASSDIEVAAECNSADEAVRLFREYQPDLALLDIRMGERTGLSAASEILRDFPKAKVLFLTTFSDNEYIAEALKIGAKGYLLKQNYEGLVPAIKAVLQGQSVFGEEIITKIPEALSEKGRKSYSDFGLTDKEFDIIKQVADGFSNKEAAQNLFLSEGTIRNYISTILEKLCLRDRTQLAIFYYNQLKCD